MAEPITCPGCQRLLRVPENFDGQMVECPDCQHRFLASISKAGEGEAAVQANPPLTVYPRDEAGAIAEPPRVSPRRYEEDDDEGDDRDRSVRRRRADLAPHRASLILTLGILSIFVAGLILGTIAWVLGNADLKEMQEGRMDPEGESQTRTGRTIGMVMVFINIVSLILVVALFCVMFGGVALVG